MRIRVQKRRRRSRPFSPLLTTDPSHHQYQYQYSHNDDSQTSPDRREDENQTRIWHVSNPNRHVNHHHHHPKQQQQQQAYNHENLHPPSPYQLQLLQLADDEMYENHYYDNDMNHPIMQVGLLHVLYEWCCIILIGCVSGMLAGGTYYTILYSCGIIPSVQRIQSYPIHLDYTTTISSLSSSSSMRMTMIVPTATIPLQPPTLSSSTVSHSWWTSLLVSPFSSSSSTPITTHVYDDLYSIQIQLELPDSYSNRYDSRMFTMKCQLLHRISSRRRVDDVLLDDHHHDNRNIQYAAPKEEEEEDDRRQLVQKDDTNITETCQNPNLHLQPLPSTVTVAATVTAALTNEGTSNKKDETDGTDCDDRTDTRVDHIEIPPFVTTPTTTPALVSSSSQQHLTQAPNHHPLPPPLRDHQSSPLPFLSSTTTSLFEETTIVLDTITRSYRYPYRSPILTCIMNIFYILPYIWNMSPSTSLSSFVGMVFSLSYQKKNHRKQIWESQIISDTIARDYNISLQQSYPLNTMTIQILQPSPPPTFNGWHQNPLVEIIGGTVIIGPEFTKLQQFIMVDYFYTCTITITLLLSFVYYFLIYTIVIRRRRRRPPSWDCPDSHSSYPNYSPHFDTNGTNDYDDVHNFDYMNDIHIDEESDDKNSDDNSDWVPLYNDNAYSNHGTPEDNTNISSNHSNHIDYNHQPSMYDLVDHNEEDDLFFDTITFGPDTTSLNRDGNAVPMDEFITATPGTSIAADTATAPLPASSVITNGPTMTTRRTDTVLPLHCDKETLRQQEQRRDITVEHNVIDPTPSVPTDTAPSIRTGMVLVATLSNNTTANVTATSQTVASSTRKEVPVSCKRMIVGTDGTMTNGLSINSNMLGHGTIASDSNIDDDVPILFQSVSLSSIPSGPHSFEPHFEPSAHIAPTTAAVGAVPTVAASTEHVEGEHVIRLLWSELQSRNHRTGRQNIHVQRNVDDTNDTTMNGDKDTDNRDELYQEYPFLAFLLG